MLGIVYNLTCILPMWRDQKLVACLKQIHYEQQDEIGQFSKSDA